MRFVTVSPNGDTYYFGDDGAAVVGEQEINGVPYLFDEDGRLLE